MGVRNGEVNAIEKSLEGQVERLLEETQQLREKDKTDSSPALGKDEL